MQCQLLQNFLNLPGIIGFSLMPLAQEEASGHAYSVGFPQGNGPSQQPSLVQGIQQIIGTTPASLEFCTFQFGPYQVDLYKVEHSSVLLVCSEGSLSSQHARAIRELMQFIKADYSALVESMQVISAAGIDHRPVPTAPHQSVSVEDVVAAMNSLSQATSRYLGVQVVVNHWRIPELQDMAWLDKFSISANGTVSFTDMDQQLSPEQLADIRLWVQQFQQRCTRIIRDYALLIEPSLSKHHWQLLFAS